MNEINLSEILKSFEFRYSKKLGQNFISDLNLLEAITCDSGIKNDDVVVEIGTGAGALTRFLANKANKVFSFEIDKRLSEILAITLKGLDNVEVIFRDVLKTSIDEIDGLANSFHLVANLPYYITTPIILKFLEQSKNVKTLTVMVQKEVGERLVAKPGTKEYGSITLATNYFGKGEIVRKVSRNMFYPSPNVDSVIVKIAREDREKTCCASDFRKVVKSAFAMRRKTLANNLCASFGAGRDIVEETLLKLFGNVMIRGETLSVDEVCLLTNSLKKFNIIN